MRRWILTRAGLTIALAFLASLVAAGGAQAVVVDMNPSATGNTVSFPTDESYYAGVALVPGTCADLQFTGTCGALENAGVPTVSSSAPCTDPSLSPDLWTFGGPHELPTDALCYHGGPVTQDNETYALTWDAPWPDGVSHNYWEGTRDYVEQFLRDVADGSGSLSSPYALTSQYTDASGNHAANESTYGGDCIDYGSVGGSSCDFGSGSPSGHDFPAMGQTGDCTPQGDSFILNDQDNIPNSVCLTDAQIQGEVTSMASQAGMVSGADPGHTPEVVVLTPPGVEDCLDATNKLCSANGTFTPAPPTATPAETGGSIQAGNYRVEITYAKGGTEYLPSASVLVTTTAATSTITVEPPPQPPSSTGIDGWYVYVTGPGGTSYYQQDGEQSFGNPAVLTAITNGAAPPEIAAFCSYHSHVDVGGTQVPYVVQPWTPDTSCDEPDAQPIPPNVSVAQAGIDVGLRLVSPLSQSQIPSIVDPQFNAWFALDGAEMNDNGATENNDDACVPLPQGLDSVTVGSSSQNPYLLQREFNNAGAISTEENSYLACAPSVYLSPAYVVPSAVDAGDVVEFDGSATSSTLIVPDSGYAWNFGDGSTATGPSVEHSYSRGGTYNVTLTVTDRGGNVSTLTQSVNVLGPNGQVVPPTTGGSTPPNQGSSNGLQVRLILLPQSLRSMLRSGVLVSVRSNEAANGYATVSITKATAKKARIKAGRGPSVTIGIGTLSNVKPGVVSLHLHLSKATADKLAHLKRVDLTVRLVLIGPGGGRVAIDAAGHY